MSRTINLLVLGNIAKLIYFSAEEPALAGAIETDPLNLKL